jgi:hypothetical protein
MALKIGSRALHLVPRPYRPLARTTGNVILRSPAIVRGVLYGRRFPASNGSAMTPAPAPAPPPNPLEAYFDSHVEGPGIWKWRHYFEAYHRHLAKFIGREVHVLEVGVYSGGSLQMWSSYFGPHCHLYGVDIQSACRAYENERMTILVGDQADRGFWRHVRATVPQLDVVIDDGGHRPEQQIVTLEELLPHLRPGGVYLCEDVYETFNPFHDYVSGMTHVLNAAQLTPGVTRPHEGLTPNALQNSIHSVHLYPFAVVLEKREAPLGVLTAPRHGTEWQPWL